MLLLYARASRYGSSDDSAESVAVSWQSGQARPPSARVKNATATRAAWNQRIDGPPALLKDKSDSTPPSGRRVELVEHPVDHHPRHRHVEPDRQRPAGEPHVALQPVA